MELTDEQIKSVMQAAIGFEAHEIDYGIILDRALIHVDDHGCWTRRTVIQIGDKLWAQSYYGSDNNGILEYYSLERVVPKERTITEYVAI